MNCALLANKTIKNDEHEHCVTTRTERVAKSLYYTTIEIYTQ